MKKGTLFLLSFILINWAKAQAESQTNTSFFQSNLKIYVVVAVLLIIFSGILLFLISMERRIQQLEKNNS